MGCTMQQVSLKVSARYKTVNGSAIFRLSDHIQRLMDSARIYFMDLGYTKAAAGKSGD